MRNRYFLSICIGWIVSFGLIIIGSLIIALFLKMSSLNEPTLSWITLILGFISLFIGGIVSGVKGKTKGWLIGCILGIGFTVMVFLIQYLGYKEPFSIMQSLHHLGYIVAAIFGGIVGVNFIASTD